MRKLTAFVCVLAFLCSIFPVNPSVVFGENVSEIPELTVYQLNNKVKAEWSTDILEQDVLFKTGFEDGDFIPSFRWGWINPSDGGQSVVTEDKYSGNKAYRVIDTLHNGNHYNYPSTSSDRSIMGFGRIYVPNGIPLSLTFYAKTDSEGTIIPYGDGGWGESLKPVGNIKIAETAPKGSTIIKLTSVAGLSKGSYITTDTTPSPVVGMYMIKEIDPSTNTVTLSTGINRTLEAGEQLMTRPWRGAWSFNTRTVYASDGWKRFSINTYVSNYADYNVLTRGGTFYIDTKTGGKLYIDEIKMGYATKVILYRDGKEIYNGYLSDYYDTEAGDYAKPNPVTSINIINEGTTLKLSWNAVSDNGSTYTYQIRAVAQNGYMTPLSSPKTINVVSGIKGYSIVIDQNPNTIPDGNITTTQTSYSKTVTPGQKYFIHIASVDNAGNMSDVKHYSYAFPALTAVAVPQNNSVLLNWWINDPEQTYNFMVYKKEAGKSEFQSIPVKDQLRVLEVYPYIPILKSWTDKYGLGKLSVNSVSIENFNANPKQIWNYDVAVFGFADSNNSKDLTASAASVVRSFIEAGKGVLLGHDTMRYFTLPNFRTLAPYLNMSLPSTNLPPWYNGAFIDKDGIQKSKIVITKKGLLTNYPWQIGDIGTELVTPYTHDVYQIANGDIWVKFKDPQDPNLNSNGNFYLTTWNNVAMIQIGHSIRSDIPPSQYATEDEQKLVVNTIFYLGQITTNTSWEDHSGQDVEPPNPVSNLNYTRKGKNITITFDASLDNGSTYEYFVRAFGQKTHNYKDSPVISATVTTGIKGYSYVIDQNENTEPDNTADTTATKINAVLEPGKTYYLHIKAIDNAGNASPTATLKIEMPPVTVTLNLTPDSDNNCIKLQWGVDDKTQSYSYKVYRKEEAESSYTIVQTTANTSWTDSNAKDNAPPEKISNINVSINEQSVVISFPQPSDKGSYYQYYVSATGETGNTANSPVAGTSVITGIKGYSYVIDKVPNTIPDAVPDTALTTIWKEFEEGGTYYLHIRAVDNAGNASEVSTVSFYVEKPLLVSELQMVSLINPPHGTVLPVNYPVSTPTRIKAGYKITIAVKHKGAETVSFKLYANGQPLIVHTENGDTAVITKSTSKTESITYFTFWLDKNTPKNTILDAKIVLQKTLSDGTQKSIVNTELGERFAVVVGSAIEDSSINLTR